MLCAYQGSPNCLGLTAQLVVVHHSLLLLGERVPNMWNSSFKDRSVFSWKELSIVELEEAWNC